MNLKTFFKRTIRTQAWLVLAFVMVITAACGGSNAAQVDELNEDLVDENAVLYRMYFDSATEDEVQIRQFTGQLQIADVEEIFGDVNTWSIDENGNHVAGPISKDGLLWNVVVSPSLVGIHLATWDPDGTISSAFDLNGDRVVDILDIRLPDGRRFSFVTEGLGMEVFEGMLLGEDPLCNPMADALFDMGDFGCGDDSSGDNSSSSGGGGGFGAISGSSFGIYDPCAGYNSRPGFNTQTKGHGVVFSNVLGYPDGAGGHIIERSEVFLILKATMS